MRKIIIILFIISSFYLIGNKDEIIIPKDSIRFRIIANSNSFEDQAIKNSIKDELVNNILSKTIDNSYENTKELINNSISEIDESLIKYNIKYNVSYGNNYFPKKTYKGITYPEGYYESLVITIGDGVGNNFWCVMYPPLCLIDDNKTSDVEYKSLAQEIINNYNKNV